MTQDDPFEQLQASVHYHIGTPIWSVEERKFQLKHQLEFIWAFDYDLQVEIDLRDIYMADIPDVGEDEFQEIYTNAIQNVKFYKDIRSTIEANVNLLERFVERAINLLTHAPHLNENIETFYWHVAYNLEVILVSIIESQQSADKRIKHLQALRQAVQGLLNGDVSMYQHFTMNTSEEQQVFMVRSKRAIEKLTTEPMININSLYTYVFEEN